MQSCVKYEDLQQAALQHTGCHGQLPDIPINVSEDESDKLKMKS